MNSNKKNQINFTVNNALNKKSKNGGILRVSLKTFSFFNVLSGKSLKREIGAT